VRVAQRADQASIALLAGWLLWATPMLGAAEARQVDRSLAAVVGGSVEVEVIAGSVTVDCWQRPEVRLQGSIDQRAELIFERHSQRVLVRVEPPSGGKSLAADLQLQTPCGGLLRIDTISGSVSVAGDREELEVSTISGNLELRLAAPTIILKTVTGSANFRGRAGTLQAEVISGSLEIAGEVEEIEANAISGRLEIDVEGLRKMRGSSISGAIVLSAALRVGAEVELEVHSGRIELRLPRSTSAVLSARTWSGPIDNRLDPNVPALRNGRGGRSLELLLGAGEGSIDLETFSGEIRLRRR